MVYNALKMFMEINPELFEEAMQEFKRNRIAYVIGRTSPQNLITSLSQ